MLNNILAKSKEIFSSWRVWMLIFFILGSYAAINPKSETQGVLIASVDTNSSAEINGVRSGEILLAINDKAVNSVVDFNNYANTLEPNKIIKINTNKASYSFLTETKDNTTSVGFSVDKIPTSNLKQGLDLVGGVRVLLNPEGKLTDAQFQDLVSITQKRLNVYGLRDISVKQVADLEGNKFLLVELAGTTQQEAIKLISQQGKFEAKIGEESVFTGADIKQVVRSAQEGAGIRDCGESGDSGWACQFEFPIVISVDAARKHAEVTSQLDVISVGTNEYLEKKLDLYLDNELVESLYISSGLKGQEATSFVIQGPGAGNSREIAFDEALASMKKFQTLLITGSLPVKLEIVKIDVISPALGKEFLRTTIIALIAAVIAVGLIIALRYRKAKIAVPIMLTSLSEIFIIFGIAALIKQNLDLAAIAGILATVGTGVDAQLVITDEVLAGSEAAHNWKEKLKRSFFIIMGSYSTVVAAMIPLMLIGAGLLKGFAIVTIIGASIGVFVTRPAYAKIIEVLLK